ncbi:MAG: response regulator transcription factor [Pseudomonadota bacterium]
MMQSAAGTLLLIEDHRDIAEMVYAYLERRGYTLDYAADGVTGLHLASEQTYDAVILDLMLPGIDGMDVCRRLREEVRSDMPVLMLTARDTLEDKVAGLDAGADDYLVKPFAMEELEARVRALIRRRRGKVHPERLEVGDLKFDTGTLVVRRGEMHLDITPIGLKLLGLLMRSSPRVVSRAELEREVWGDILPDSDTLRSHMYNLRKAVDRPFETHLIHTVQSAGYRVAVLDEG